MQGNSCKRICSFVETEQGLFEFANHAVTFKNEDVILFGDDLDRSLELTRFLCIGVDRF
jgi:hypothetical protein